MKKIIGIVMCLCVFAMCVSGCSFLKHDTETDAEPSVATSIVYVYVDPTEDEHEETRPTHPTIDDADTTESGSLVGMNSDDEVIREAIAAAEEALQARDFDEAQSIIAAANGSVSDNSALVAEQSRIADLRPVDLMEMNMLAGNPSICGREQISTGETVNCIGFTVEDIAAGDTLRTQTGVSWATNGEYDLIQFSLALMNDSSKNSVLDHFCEVWCDGICVYTSPTITAGSMPENIEVDISGAQSVQIVFGVTNNTESDWLGSMWAWDYYPISWSIVDPVIYPAYTPLEME